MRIDRELTEKYGSRTKAARAVEQGEVLVNGKIVSASYELKPSDIMTFGVSGAKYVSMGGYKLQKALDEFGIDVNDLIFADIGASTGGFTDCLLQRGAKKVYCVDVGENQLDRTLLGDKTVVIDNFNARNLTPDIFDDALDGAVADVSFISLTYIMEGVAASLGDGKIFLGLIKPQFELDRGCVGKNGIVKEPAYRRLAINRVYMRAVGLSLAPVGLTNAPIVSGKNKEFPMLFVKGGKPKDLKDLLKDVEL